MIIIKKIIFIKCLILVHILLRPVELVSFTLILLLQSVEEGVMTYGDISDSDPLENTHTRVGM